MIQSILVLILACIACLFLGQRLFKQWVRQENCDGCSMGKASQKK